MSLDMILNVMNAADKAKLGDARQKLTSMGAVGSNLFQKISNAIQKRPALNVEEASGADLVAGVMAAASPKQMAESTKRLNDLDSRAVPRENSTKIAAMKKLEGSLLTTLVDQMLPKNDESLYGKGTSGEVARQLQVEQFANAAADSGALDLASIANKQPETPSSNEFNRDLQWPYFVRRSITPYAS